MHEEPLHLIPTRFRDEVQNRLNANRAANGFRAKIHGELCPFCRYVYGERLKRYDGDWTRVIADVRVQAADSERAGPPGHRHVPAQG